MSRADNPSSKMTRYNAARRRQGRPKRYYSMNSVDYVNTKLNKLARRIGNPEVKHLDYVFTGVTPVIAGLVTLISAIAQGDTDITRTGNKIRLKRIEYAFEWGIIPDTGAPDTGAYSNNRLIILADSQPTTTAITQAMVIDQTSLNETYSYRQIDTQDPKRFKFYCDRKFELVALGQQTATQAYADMSRGVKMIRGNKYFPRGLRMMFNGTAANQASCGTNALYTLMSTDAAQGASCSGYVRMYFTDL